MSIKQNGGVFGRNPTFNDVTIEGQLTFNGDIDISSDLKVDGDLDVTGDVDVVGDITANAMTIESSVAKFEVTDTDTPTTVFLQSTNSQGRLGTSTNTNLYIQANSTPMLSVRTDGYVGVMAGDLSVETGNLVIGTSGKGIDFSATGTGTGTSTSELLDDYEEGAWTPVLSVGLTVVGTPSFTGTYTKIGNTVTAIASLTASTSVAAIGGSQMVNGLPYSVSGVTAGSMTNGNLNEGVNVAGYLDRIYALASTAAAPSLIATIVYKV